MSDVQTGGKSQKQLSQTNRCCASQQCSQSENDCDDFEFEFEDDNVNSPTYLASDRANSETASPSGCSPTKATNSQYKVYSPEELMKFMENTVGECCEVLGLPFHIVEVLLRCCKWRSDVLLEDWSDAESRILVKAGFPPYYRAPTAASSPSPEATTFDCPIIVETVPFKDTTALACGHRYSNSCWKQYLVSKLPDIDLLFARCVSYKCPEVVPLEVWRRFLPHSDFEKFRRFRAKSYVEASRYISPCPRPNCDYSIQLLGGNGDVGCTCGHSFCFYCADEPHRPVPCEIIKAWHEKNMNEADNVSWILLNTKSCPGCKQPIEKDHGCMHMTCRCGVEFCWICLVEWKKHCVSSYYNCNLYKEKSGEQKDAVQRRAKEALERYAHYFERYRAHNTAERMSRGDQLNKIKETMQIIHGTAGHLVDIIFLEEAVRQIADCRRFMKWTYAYSYFAKWKADGAKVLFEYHQGELERSLDLLHETTENFDPEKYIGDEAESFRPLFEFKTNLVNLTRVVKKYFQRMCDAFETEFIDVNQGC
eukprot:Lankesteria_metandrocarpae@DN5071_c0_g1_i2.p1